MKSCINSYNSHRYPDFKTGVGCPNHNPIFLLPKFMLFNPPSNLSIVSLGTQVSPCVQSVHTRIVSHGSVLPSMSVLLLQNPYSQVSGFDCWAHQWDTIACCPAFPQENIVRTVMFILMMMILMMFILMMMIRILKCVFNFTQMPSNRRSLGTVGNCHSFFSKAFVEKLRGELLVGNYYSFCGAPHLLTFLAKLCRKEVPQFEVKGEHPCPDSQLSNSWWPWWWWLMIMKMMMVMTHDHEHDSDNHYYHHENHQMEVHLFEVKGSLSENI